MCPPHLSNFTLPWYHSKNVLSLILLTFQIYLCLHLHVYIIYVTYVFRYTFTKDHAIHNNLQFAYLVTS